MLSGRAKSVWWGLVILGLGIHCSNTPLPEQQDGIGGASSGVIGAAGSGAGGAVSGAGGAVSGAGGAVSGAGGAVSSAGGAAGKGAGGVAGAGAGGSGGNAVVNPGPPVSAVAAGGYHTCALLTDGTVRCWGLGQGGVLGDGSQLSQTVPTPVIGLSGAVRVFAAYTDSCAQLGDGTTRCWGFNLYGQLGDGTTTEHDVPAATLGPVVLNGGISLGEYHSCGVGPDGSGDCWGSNFDGQIGDGTKIDRHTPTPLGLMGVKQVVAGDVQSCAVLLDGTVSCWGYNGVGTLGDGTLIDHLTPAPVPGLSGVVQMGLGGNIACALIKDGSVECWGDNTYGQLGAGPNAGANASRPQLVQGLAKVTQLSVGDSFVCALSAGGTVSCWGMNGHGELGDGTRFSHSTPNPVPQLTGVVQVSAGITHACAVTSAGTLLCWGDELAYVGTGPNVNRLSPTVVTF